MSCFEVRRISSAVAMDLVMRFHYSQRKVGATDCFGLFGDGVLRGCCVFSIPASYTLCKGVCGDALKSHVRELSRLVITNGEKNAASRLIGAALRSVGNCIVVSYADCNDHVGHVGYVYQATNWLYTGQGNAEPKWCHPVTGEVISYTRRHIDRKAASLGLDWRKLTKVKQTGKHRYVIFTGSRAFRRMARRELRYPVTCYPKGDTSRHTIDVQRLPLFGDT